MALIFNAPTNPVTPSMLSITFLRHAREHQMSFNQYKYEARRANKEVLSCQLYMADVWVLKVAEDAVLRYNTN